jgi:hypothetical protein
MVIALALTLAACGGDDDDDGATTTTAPSSGFAPPSGGTPPPSAGTLPPTLVQCFADQGFELEDPTQIHSAPPQVVRQCFEALHQGGGAP